MLFLLAALPAGCFLISNQGEDQKTGLDIFFLPTSRSRRSEIAAIVEKAINTALSARTIIAHTSGDIIVIEQ